MRILFHIGKLDFFSPHISMNMQLRYGKWNLFERTYSQLRNTAMIYVDFGNSYSSAECQFLEHNLFHNAILEPLILLFNKP